MALEIIDTHCHIHEILHSAGKDAPVRDKWLKGGKTDPDAIIADAEAAGVIGMLCIGTDVEDSALAADFVQGRPQAWASIGIHPHEAKRYIGDSDSLVRFAELAERAKVVAVGECGLDYFYNHSSKADQMKVLRFQIELAQQHGLPMTFHVRDAFEDFWPVFDSYKGIRGVLHSFTANRKVLDEALARNLYIALNGIVTFSNDQEQLAAVRAVPLENLLLETDAPFLTPAPNRGKICEPKHAASTLAFVAQLQGKTAQQLADATTANARRLFNLAG